MASSSDIILPHDNDVLFSKDHNINTYSSHTGNQQLDILINTQYQNFISNSNKQKEQEDVVTYIIQSVYSLNGRFLVEDVNSTAATGHDASIVAGIAANSQVHSTISNKLWKNIEYEKIFDIVLHRLYDKEYEMSKMSNSKEKKMTQPTDMVIVGPPPQQQQSLELPSHDNNLTSGASSMNGERDTIQHHANGIINNNEMVQNKSSSSSPLDEFEFDSNNVNEEEMGFQEEQQQLNVQDVMNSQRIQQQQQAVQQHAIQQQHGIQQQQAVYHQDNNRFIHERLILQQQQQQRDNATVISAQQLQDFATAIKSSNRPSSSTSQKKRHINNNSKVLPKQQSNDNVQNIQRVISTNEVMYNNPDKQRQQDNGMNNLQEWLDKFAKQGIQIDDQHSTQTEQLTEQTLQQWIKQRLNSQNNVESSSSSTDYIKSALPIAIKLIELFIHTKEKEDQDDIPLDCIKTKNIYLYLKKKNQRQEESELQNEKVQEETIHLVWIMRSPDDDPSVGSMMSRLFAVGLILYELFSTEEPLLEDMPPSSNTATESLQGIDLNDITENDQRPQKRSHHLSSQTGDEIYTSIAKLEDKGLPRSIYTLVKNLLDCSKGDYCGDEAYSSFVDLRQDLLLMMNDPTRFLDNLQVSGSIPVLDICDKLYGRQDEEDKLNKLYQQYIQEKIFKGVIISGGAGAGKSMLALHTKRLTNQSNGHFCLAKFEQNEMYSKPLATIGDMFNTLCEAFVEGASSHDLELVEKELENRLGNQASLLAGVVPSLIKLMPSSSHQLLESSSTCIDAAVSMRYLFGELLRVISSHSKRPISLFIDDLQFADHASLHLIGYLLYSAKGGSSVFFIFCHRDDEDSLSGPFSFWLSSISMISMESIELGNMSVESVNTLVSETLHLSPRITLPLSTVLHHKTRGNPLFLRQLLGSLYRRGYIYVDLSLSRWSWDMDKIEQEPISSSVIALLTNEMKRLPSSLQFGLGVASCLGSSVQKEVLDILSKDLNVDLVDILKEVSQRGFMDNMNDGTTFRFTHDKIQEAAYELESKEKRRANHLRYGLLLCTHTLHGSRTESNELFFTSITQINHGGPDIVHDPREKSTIAGLNLKAGRLSTSLSDYAAAFALFEHGISYLGSDKWASNYDLSIELYDAAAEAACVLNKRDAVTSHVEELVAHAKTFDDSVHCLSIAAKGLQNAWLLKESMESIFVILIKLGEDPPRAKGDSTLKAEFEALNKLLQDTSDESLLNMQHANDKKLVTLHRLYADLAHTLHFTKPGLIGSVACRMVELTMKNGITPTAPLSFAYHGEMLASTGKIEEGCRLGRLALKLVEKNPTSSKYKPLVILLCHQTILWYAEPLQSTAQAHQAGYKAGQQMGDFLYSIWNLQLSIALDYLSGQNLFTIQSACKDYIKKRLAEKQQNFLPSARLLYYQAVALRQGLNQIDAGARVDNIPTEAELFAKKDLNVNLRVGSINHKLARAFLFRQLSNNLLDELKISETIIEMKLVLRPLLCMGIFFEGLSCFLYSRGSDDIEKTKLIERGRSTLAKVRSLAEHSSWNWQNKVLLLEAMEMHAMGNLDEAGPRYISSIQSAQEHKFIQDEAIASEMAGEHLFELGRHSEAYTLYKHSIKCFNEWGANAVSSRVEADIQAKFGDDVSHLEATIDDILGDISLSIESNQKRSYEG